MNFRPRPEASIVGFDIDLCQLDLLVIGLVSFSLNWVGMNYYVGYGASDFTHRFGYFLLSVLVGSDK